MQDQGWEAVWERQRHMSKHVCRSSGLSQEVSLLLVWERREWWKEVNELKCSGLKRKEMRGRTLGKCPWSLERFEEIGDTQSSDVGDYSRKDCWRNLQAVVGGEVGFSVKIWSCPGLHVFLQQHVAIIHQVKLSTEQTLGFLSVRLGRLGKARRRRFGVESDPHQLGTRLRCRRPGKS